MKATVKCSECGALFEVTTDHKKAICLHCHTEFKVRIMPEHNRFGKTDKRCCGNCKAFWVFSQTDCINDVETEYSCDFYWRPQWDENFKRSDFDPKEEGTPSDFVCQLWEKRDDS